MSREPSLMSREWDEISRENPYYGIVSWPEYEDVSAVDEARFFGSGRIQADTLLARAGIAGTRNLTMLEIGCGLGRMTHRFAELFEEVYAVDVSQAMIEKAAAKWGSLGNVHFLRSNGEDLADIPDAAVDFVLSFLVLQHVTSPEIVLRYVRESSRVLRPSGKVFLQLRTRMPRSLGRRLRDALARRLPAGVKAVVRRLAGTSPAPSRRSIDAWWNQGLVWVPPSSEKSTAVKAIIAKTVWRGCGVSLDDLRRTCRDAGLVIRSLEGVGTQYTFLTAIKRT